MRLVATNLSSLARTDAGALAPVVEAEEATAQAATDAAEEGEVEAAAEAAGAEEVDAVAVAAVDWNCAAAAPDRRPVMRARHLGLGH